MRMLKSRTDRWNEVVGRIADLWLPPPPMTISEWADAYRRLSAEASGEHGRWRTGRAEYQRGIMDACCGQQYDTVVVETGTQIGKTEIIGNTCGYHIHWDPCPILILQPTLDQAQSWSKDRFTPMLRETPELRRAVGGDGKSKKTGNTIRHKRFRGGHATISGANSPASLRARPIRLLLLDEVDAYPISAGKEGDPVDLARQRTTNFWNSLVLMVSTPTNLETSRIHKEFLLTDQRYFHVPCPDCKTMQVLKWANVKFDRANPLETAFYACPECGSVWSDAAKNRAVKKGEWRATAKAQGRRAGFHISSLYSPWQTLGQIAQKFWDAHQSGDMEKMQVWVNTSLGEPWEEHGEGVDQGELAERVENYDESCLPEDILVITAGVDVQKDRLECRTVGWAEHKERWLIEKKIFRGDPEKGEVWDDLDDFLLKRYDVGGAKLPIACTLIDSGFHADRVYQFCKPRQKRWVFATKGSSTYYAPLLGKPTITSRHRATLFAIGTERAKDSIILSSLRLDKHGPNSIHFPHTMDGEDFAQLTAEVKRIKMVGGQRKVYWHPVRERNEELDLQVLNIAAIDTLDPVWDKIRSRREKAQSRRRAARPKAKGGSPNRGGSGGTKPARKKPKVRVVATMKK